MQSPFTQLQSSSGFLKMVYTLPFMHSYSLPLFFSAPINPEVDCDSRSVVSNKQQSNSTYNEHYQSQSKRTIILTKKPAKRSQKLIYSKISDSNEQTTKMEKKCFQKETRNINSNLMRIFLKNLIELRIYGKKIERIGESLKADFSEEQFYLWIEGFNINYKNYIRTSQVCRLMKSNQPEHFRKTFGMLLAHFSRELGVLHCLTSKRIEQASIKMHLSGLRTLSNDLQAACSSFKK